MSHLRARGNSGSRTIHRRDNTKKKISLSEAMDQLRSMFPDHSDSFIKDTLLDSQGHMEKTIEILLRGQQDGQSIDSSSSHGTYPFPDERDFGHTLSAGFLCIPSSAQRHVPLTASRPLDEDKLARNLRRHIELERGLVMSGLVTESSSSELYRNYRKQEKINRVGAYPAVSNETQRQQQSGFSKLSEMAKKKLGEFQARFRRTSTNQRPEPGDSELEYMALPQRDNYDSDDEVQGF